MALGQWALASAGALFRERSSSYLQAMSTPVEYLFAATLSVAEHAARKQGWHPHGRSGWIKPDGNEVHFICFAEQLAAVPAGTRVHRVGRAG